VLRLVPSDRFFDNPDAKSGSIGDDIEKGGEVCGNVVRNESYLITEVEHKITKAGNWQVHLDLNLLPDVDIKSYTTYFNPVKDEWVDRSEINDDGELKDAETAIAQVNEDGEIVNGNWLFESI